MKIQKLSERIASKQKRLYFALLGGVITLVSLIVYFSKGEEEPQTAAIPVKFDLVSRDVKAENIRLSNLETFSDVLNDRLQALEKSLLDVEEEKSLIEREKNFLAEQTQELTEKIQSLETEMNNKAISSSPSNEDFLLEKSENSEPHLHIWEITDKTEDKNVLFEIPAGSVVKAVLVSGADCSVAVHKPTGPNMVLLRPLDNGKLPRNVKVPLKGSIIIGNAIGDLSSERVYIRAERMTLVERNGSFVETEVSAYVSGEDGREGMRGVVVDRSGQIITRAAFAAFLQGVGQTVQATLNNQTIEKLSQVNADKTVLNIDMLRSSAFQGGSIALSKLSDYYIKRAEQLQPAIQIAAGRTVDIVFTKTVKIGEKDLKKKFEREREAKMRNRADG